MLNFRKNFFSFILISLLCLTSFFDAKKCSMVYGQTDSKSIIVGELSGKVSPDEISSLIVQRYYPIADKKTDLYIELITQTTRELIYKIHYPDANAMGHPEWLKFRFFDSERSLAAAIITDRIDFAITESDEIAEEIEKSTKTVYIRHRFKNPNYVKLLAFNNRHAAFRNIELRKALTFAINRKYIYTHIFKSRAFFADGPISKESKNHAPSLRDYKYSPKDALTILHRQNWHDENGDGILDQYGVPFKISLIHEKGVLLEEQIARRVKIDWNKIGVDVNNIPLSRQEIKNRLASGNYVVILMSQQFDDDLESFEKYFRSTSKDNFLGYHNSTTDMYINLYYRQNSSTQPVMFQAIQNQISKDFPAAFLFFPWIERIFINTTKFKNYKTQRIGMLPFVEWELR